MNELEAMARKYEAFETDPWAAEAILSKEILTSEVIDPCCGRGVLTNAARRWGYDVLAYDLAPCWGFGLCGIDFLASKTPLDGVTLFMNPPFSQAVDFVRHGLDLRARKIVCFQRLSWYEGSKIRGKKRGQFWEDTPPNRIYICGDRATCWRMDLSPEDIRGRGNTPTAHAWFIWEQGQPPGTLTGHIYKEDAISRRGGDEQ